MASTVAVGRRPSRLAQRVKHSRTILPSDNGIHSDGSVPIMWGAVLLFAIDAAHDLPCADRGVVLLISRKRAMLNLLVYWALPHDNGFRRCPNGAVLAMRLRGSRYASRDFRRYKPRLFRLSRSPLAYSRFRPLWMLAALPMRRAAHAPVPPSSPREPRPAHRSAPDVDPCVVGGHRDCTVSCLATPAITDAVVLKMHGWAHARRRAILAVAVPGIFPVTGHRHGQHLSPKRPSAALRP